MITVLADGHIEATNPAQLADLSGAHLFTGIQPNLTLLSTTMEQHATVSVDEGRQYLDPPSPSAPLADNTTSTDAATGRNDAQPSSEDYDAGASSRIESSMKATLDLRILGRTRLFYAADEHNKVEITTTLKGRQRELLVTLAAHPDGVSRDGLIDMVWPNAASGSHRPINTLHTTLSRLRHAIAEATGGAINDLTIVDEARYRLDPTRVEVDYWQLSDAVTAYRMASTEKDRAAASRSIVETYRGELAEGIDAEWVTAPREIARRNGVDAVGRLAHATNAQPHETLALLEIACTFDPYNEALYRDVMHMQHRLGQTDAVSRTLRLLELRLAEIDQKPSHETTALSVTLQHESDR